MKRWIGATILPVTLICSGRTAMDSAVAAPSPSLPQKTQATTAAIDARHYREATRPYPHYYDRPDYYAPAPFFPLPPFFGYGWKQWR